jgi:hypothetical protein
MEPDMSDTKKAIDRNGNTKTWSDPKQAFEVWKYYAATGGADKNWAIQIDTWLLAFSAGIIGFYATGKLTEEAFAVIWLGILISFVAAVTALLYGGYAAWNWAIADKIAQTYDWTEQCPDYYPFQRSEVACTAKIPILLAEPRPNKIAHIFWLFFWGSLVSLGFHIYLLSHVMAPRAPICV